MYESAVSLQKGWGITGPPFQLEDEKTLRWILRTRCHGVMGCALYHVKMIMNLSLGCIKGREFTDQLKDCQLVWIVSHGRNWLHCHLHRLDATLQYSEWMMPKDQLMSSFLCSTLMWGQPQTYTSVRRTCSNFVATGIPTDFENASGPFVTVYELATLQSKTFCECWVLRTAPCRHFIHQRTVPYLCGPDVHALVETAGS